MNCVTKIYIKNHLSISFSIIKTLIISNNSTILVPLLVLKRFPNRFVNRFDWIIQKSRFEKTIRSRALLQRWSMMMARRGVYKPLCNDWRAKVKDVFLFPKKKAGLESVLRKHGGVRERNFTDASSKSETLSHHTTGHVARIHTLKLFKSESEVWVWFRFSSALFSLCLNSFCFSELFCVA